MNNIMDGILTRINRRAEEINIPYLAFAIFGIVTYPLYYCIWKYFLAPGYNNLTLRLVVVVLCIVLLLHKKWPEALKKYLPLYWYATVCYSLPFLFTFFLLKNNFSHIWTLNAVTTVVLIVLLLDLLTLSIVLPIGMFAGFLAYYFTNGIPHLPGNWFSILTAYASAIIFGALFAHSNKLRYHEKLTTSKLLAAGIAHELRTPLAAIKGGATGLQSYLSKLLYTYRRAQEENLKDIPFIRPVQFTSLEHSLRAIEKETDASNLVINMLLTNLGSSQIEVGQFENLSITHCIEEALQRYPIPGCLRDAIHFKHSKDFVFSGSEILTIHVFFNLLKNAIYYIKAADKGEIFITIENENDKHQLHFKDTGSGISQKDLKNVFKQFYSKTAHGTGIGLAFCKTVMHAYGGDITCQSKKGEFTEFVLTFPKLEESHGE